MQSKSVPLDTKNSIGFLLVNVEYDGGLEQHSINTG